MHTMERSSSSLYEQYQPWRRVAEFAFWPAHYFVNAVANSVTTHLELERRGSSVEFWEPALWEGSSALMLTVLVPAVVWLTRRLPLHWDTWLRVLPWHVLASLVYSLVHVVGMVGLRHIAYAAQGSAYDFGNWPLELSYEYLKDVRSYGVAVVVIEGYRLLLRRLQGEARLLDAPDESSNAVEPIDRPERFLVRKLGREFLIAAAEIEWLQASGNYVNLHVHGRDYPLRSTIVSIESRLDVRRFVRIHRSYIVNLDCIAMIEPLDVGDARVHMKDGSTLPCSRRYRAALREHVVRS
jgi:hypothetical protein